MKQRIFTLAIALFGFVAAKANNGTPGTGPGDGKRDEINGTVINADTRKQLKDVRVTAIIFYKKEKIELTDDDGNFAFDELKPGTYKFIFEKAGFKRITKEKIVVKTDEAFQLNIEMIEANDFDVLPSP